MLRHAFPNLEWLKQQAENRFVNRGWPNVILNVKTTAIFRDNIPGPLSLFSNVSGKTLVEVDGRTSVVNEDHFFISNNSQRYTLQVEKNQCAETFNIHFGESWLKEVVENENVEFYNKLYPKDEVVKQVLAQLKVSNDKTKLEKEELLALLIAHLLRVNRNEKIRLESLDTVKFSTRQDIIRRIHLATDYIYAFYDEDISLDDLSKISMLSKFHFIRAFRDVYHVTPHKFLNTVRINKAKDLLRNTELDLMGISHQVGINDSSSFSRLFKKYTGSYPTVYRSSVTF